VLVLTPLHSEAFRLVFDRIGRIGSIHRGSPIVLYGLVNVWDILAYPISRHTYTVCPRFVAFPAAQKNFGVRAVHVNGWVWWSALPRVSNGPGTRASSILFGAAIRVSRVSRKLLATGCGLFSHVCSLNSLFYKMLAWFFHCEGATIRQLEGSECHESQLASCFKGSDEVERTIAHVRSQDSPNFQEASIWISGVVWPNHSSKGVCPKTVTAFHWLIMFIMNTCHETRGMAASPFTQKKRLWPRYETRNT